MNDEKRKLNVSDLKDSKLEKNASTVIRMA